MVLEKYEDAAALFQQALIINPCASEQRINLIMVYLQLGKWKEAQDEVEVVLKTDASPDKLLLWLGSRLHYKPRALAYLFLAVWIAFLTIYLGAMIFEIMVLNILLVVIFIFVMIYVIWTRKKNKAVASIAAGFFVMGLSWLMIIVLRPYP